MGGERSVADPRYQAGIGASVCAGTPRVAGRLPPRSSVTFRYLEPKESGDADGCGCQAVLVRLVLDERTPELPTLRFNEVRQLGVLRGHPSERCDRAEEDRPLRVPRRRTRPIRNS